MRILRPGIFAAGILALGMAGCNSAPPSANVPAPTAYRVPGVTPQGFSMPQGEGCAADIARFEAILGNDLNAGHVSQSVFNQIKLELAPARTACAAGRDGEARTLVVASRKRHGYPF